MNEEVNTSNLAPGPGCILGDTQKRDPNMYQKKRKKIKTFKQFRSEGGKDE